MLLAALIKHYVCGGMRATSFLAYFDTNTDLYMLITFQIYFVRFPVLLLIPHE